MRCTSERRRGERALSHRGSPSFVPFCTNIHFCFFFNFPRSDFLLLVLKDLITKRPDLKIVLMSATLNANLFSQYFYDCPTVHIPGRTSSNPNLSISLQSEPLPHPFNGNLFLQDARSPLTSSSLRTPSLKLGKQVHFRNHTALERSPNNPHVFTAMSSKMAAPTCAQENKIPLLRPGKPLKESGGTWWMI